MRLTTPALRSEEHEESCFVHDSAGDIRYVTWAFPTNSAGIEKPGDWLSSVDYRGFVEVPICRQTTWPFSPRAISRPFAYAGAFLISEIPRLPACNCSNFSGESRPIIKPPLDCTRMHLSPMSNAEPLPGSRQLG